MSTFFKYSRLLKAQKLNYNFFRLYQNVDIPVYRFQFLKMSTFVYQNVDISIKMKKRIIYAFLEVNFLVEIAISVKMLQEKSN